MFLRFCLGFPSFGLGLLNFVLSHFGAPQLEFGALQVQFLFLSLSLVLPSFNLGFPSFGFKLLISLLLLSSSVSHPTVHCGGFLSSAFCICLYLSLDHSSLGPAQPAGGVEHMGLSRWERFKLHFESTRG